ncbi:lipid A deacylase LpxR family protein [Marinobacterium jannaschii]|uniref:lipid A deacylase LpxR family protein n=1 Tax=Marinobacterium jannaschii TaxID=64970 RepID=UPI0004867BB6|nr:lipid A deacylase LpxR family protein [Marinobacterium jannaschii]
MRFSRSLTLATSLLAGAASAADSNALPWTFNLYVENDLFAETDQNYTSGVRMSWVSPNVEDYLTDPILPNWMQDVNKLLPLFDPEPTSKYGDRVQRNMVIGFGQQIYTPEDIDRRTVDPNDRPYAGWLYGNVAYHSRTKDKLNSVELNLGIVGPAALGETTQDFIHDLRGFEKFNGWDNQLENELGVQLVYEHKNRIIKGYTSDIFGYDVIVHSGASIGNVATYLNAGGEIRFGWRLPQDFGTAALRPGGDNAAPGRTDDRFHLRKRARAMGLHAFISSDARFVVQDIFLDGNTFEDSHSIDKEYLVGEISIGVAAIYEGWKVSFARVHRSKEFKNQREGHNFGSISISYTY